MSSLTVPAGAALIALGDALRRDIKSPSSRSASFVSRDAYARVAPADNHHGPMRRWNVGYSPSVSVIGVGTAIELLMQCLAHVADQGGGNVTLWRDAAVADDDRAATRVGLEIDRELNQMTAALPIYEPEETDIPQGITFRDFRPHHDDAAVLAVNNSAFLGHGEQGEWTQSVLSDRCSESWFDPNWFIVAERDGEIVGFNWLKRHLADDDNAEYGEIYVIGVSPSEQGKGLGKALALAGLERVATDGLKTAKLFVSTTNGPAIAMYNRLGFAITRTDRAFTALIAAAD